MRTIWLRRGEFGRATAGALAAGLLALLVPANPFIPSATASIRRLPPNRPNILLIVSDDQTSTNFTRDLMPNVFSQLVDKGVLFDRAYDVTGQCCPSRSEILTGLYEHHTGVDGNTVALSRPTIVQTLHDLGYRTSLTGKYLNSWPCTIRPEFDQWICSGSGQSTYTLKNPTLNVNGIWTNFTGYTTDILASYTTDFIASTPEDQPFFAMYTPTSPHLPANDDRCTSPVTPYRPPSYDEDTQNDGKPLYEQRQPLGAQEVKAIDRVHAAMTRVLPCLDTSIETILSSLGDRESNTLVFFISDNGFLYGEHRRWEKYVTYEESVHVPMVIRYPPLVPETNPFATEALAENIDIVPTIADILGIHWGTDGLSLTPILTGTQTTVRDAALLEWCQGVSYPCAPPIVPFGMPLPPSMAAVVTPTYKYIENSTGEFELYDLSQDPYEMTNLAGDPNHAGTQAELAADLAALRGPPPVDTTIATGPQGTLDARIAMFTFFSQSRLSTYQCRLDTNGVQGAWSPCNLGSVTFGPLADGSYTVEVYGTDEFGSADPTPDTRSFTIQSTGPNITIVSAPIPHQKGNTLTFTLSSSTPNVTFQCRFGLYGTTGTWTPCDPSGVTYAGLLDGVYLFQAEAVDSQGVVSDPPAQYLVNVDNTGPVMTLLVSPPTSTRGTDATFQFEPNEPLTGSITCTLDNGTGADCSAGTFSATGLAEGAHTLKIRGSDELGNSGTTKFKWTVDDTPAVLTLTGPATYTNKTTANFTITGNELLDKNMGPTCALDGDDQVSLKWLSPTCSTSTVTFKQLADGVHTLQVSGADLAGNVSSTVTWTWTVDTIPPVTTITSGPSNPTSSTTATFQFVATDATPVTFACVLDGGLSAPCATGVTYQNLPPGQHTFSVTGTDAAGNVGAPASWIWTITR